MSAISWISSSTDVSDSADNPCRISETKKGKHRNPMPPFSDCVSKQVMLPCVNHDAGRDGHRRDGRHHDAHDARRRARLILQMQIRQRWG